MCGICGVMQVSGPTRPLISAEGLERMMDEMVHRGPDDLGSHVGDGVALGARRLSIIDVAGGHQPLANEGGTVWAAQNGELYNHSDLRKELEADGHVFRTTCDTEILPHVYEKYGFAVPEQLRGKFGLAIWDEKERRGLIARDRLGVKPLYYAILGDRLVFASELKSVLASGLVEPELDLHAISAYLTLGFVPGALTPFKGVAKLPPGCKLVVADGKARLERYWSYPSQRAIATGKPEELAEELLARLEEAVRLRLMSDVPLGAMLSGGLDSSLIVALMARNMTSPVKTFSVGFVEAGAANELADAREVARFLGTEHHELALSFESYGVDLVDLAWQLDEPLADLSALGFHALSQLAASEVKVALSGQGADELLGGYSRHRNAALATRWDRLPDPISKLGAAALRGFTPRAAKAGAILAAPTTVDRILLMKSFISADLGRELFRDPIAVHSSAARDAIAGAVPEPDGSFFNSVLEADARLSLVDDMLHYFDRASMAHSLEVRVPFLDHHLVEFCATLPPDAKVRGLTTKYLLKRAARGVVPDRIIDKPKAGFFYPALAAWFQAEAPTVRDLLLGGDARTSPYLDHQAVAKLIDGQMTTGGMTEPLLTVLMLEVWLRSLDRAAPARQEHLVREATASAL